jgi:hypothetical protein
VSRAYFYFCGLRRIGADRDGGNSTIPQPSETMPKVDESLEVDKADAGRERAALPGSAPQGGTVATTDLSGRSFL